MTESIDATCDVMEAGIAFFTKRSVTLPCDGGGRGLGSGPKSLEVSHVEQTDVTFVSPSSWVKR